MSGEMADQMDRIGVWQLREGRASRRLFKESLDESSQVKKARKARNAMSADLNTKRKNLADWIVDHKEESGIRVKSSASLMKLQNIHGQWRRDLVLKSWREIEGAQSLDTLNYQERINLFLFKRKGSQHTWIK